MWAEAILPAVDPGPPRTARDIARKAAGAAIALGKLPDPLSEEIRRLQSLVDETVRVRTPQQSNDTIPELVSVIDSGRIDGGAFETVIDAILRNDRLLPALAGLASMDQLAHEVRKWRRQQVLKEFRQVVTVEVHRHHELPTMLRREAWMFGGTLVHMPGLDEIAGLAATVIPLRRFDEALHIVLVDRAQVDDLVCADGTGYRVSAAVGTACDRAREVVLELNRRGAGTPQPLYADSERPHVTVVIGHPDWVTTGIDSDVIHQRLRLYNTFMAGINVITYAELLATAQRMLDIDNPYGDVPGTPEEFGRDLDSIDRSGGSRGWST